MCSSVQVFELSVLELSRFYCSLVRCPIVYCIAGFQDQVRCYACDGGLQHWDTGDEPWIEHARWFAHCVHVRTHRGEAFVAMVQAALQDPQDDVCIVHRENYSEHRYPTEQKI